ncbi:PqqD family peptide modification chaperone [Glutamicibacter mishrai]|uniref:PqqD family peptide modification chaperone n=1 Tax=Glutamicibacter mishrai TaxID=1775880 RepID=UPI003F7B1771
MTSEFGADTTIRTAFFDNGAIPDGFSLHAVVMGISTLVRVVAHPEHFDARIFREMTSIWSPASEVGDQSSVMGNESLPLITMGKCNDVNAEAVASEFSTVVTRVSLHVLKKANQLLLHAGGIADDHGNVAVIVGPSGRGKTTTIREMAREYSYVSDETIAIDAEGRVLPYPKPLSVIVSEHKHKQQIPSAQLGMKQLESNQLRIGSIVILERGKSGSKGDVEPVSLAEALNLISSQSSYLTFVTHPLAFIARLMNETGGFKRLTAGSIDFLASLAPKLWEPYHAEQWEHVMPSDRRNSFVGSEVVDALSTIDGVLVMTSEGKLHTLSAIASGIWRGLFRGARLENIGQKIESEFGTPLNTSIHNAVSEYVEELKALRIISDVAEF